MDINHKVFLNINLVLSVTLYYVILLTQKFPYASLSVLQKKERERMYSIISESRICGFCFVNSNNEVKNVQTKLELALGHNRYSILTSLVYLENMYCVRFSNILILLRLLTVAAKCNNILSQ